MVSCNSCRSASTVPHNYRYETISRLHICQQEIELIESDGCTTGRVVALTTMAGVVRLAEDCYRNVLILDELLQEVINTSKMVEIKL